MQFPAELTQEACRTRPRELRLICIYFFTAHFFQVSTMVGPGGQELATSWGAPQASTPPAGLWVGTSTCESSPRCNLSQPLPLSGLRLKQSGWRHNYNAPMRPENPARYVHVPGRESDKVTRFLSSENSLS